MPITHKTITMPAKPNGAEARAHSNIALAKYWGKASVANNIPAVPSISVTLQAMTTTTSVRFDASIERDTLWLNGTLADDRATRRVSGLLDRVRAVSQATSFAFVRSDNDFPTASGLASSASAFAALAMAAVRAAGLPMDHAMISDLARRSSASAARSIFGGFVRLPAGNKDTALLPACQLCGSDHWDLRVVVCVVSDKSKAVASTDGMMHTAQTSPYYGAWLDLCAALSPRIERSILERDLPGLGEAAEQSALAMHACALSSAPGLLYFEPASIGCLHAVRSLRRNGLEAYATMDAGPHVKVLTSASNANEVETQMQQVPGVIRTIVSKIGGDANVEDLP